MSPYLVVTGNACFLGDQCQSAVSLGHVAERELADSAMFWIVQLFHRGFQVIDREAPICT